MKTIITLLLILSAGTLYSQDYEKVLLGGYLAEVITHDNGNGTLIAGTQNTDLFVVRLKDSGDIIWQKNYDFEINGNYLSIVEVFKIIPTTDSCFLLTGRSYNSINDTYDSFLFKMDANGDEIWHSFFEYGGDHNCTSSTIVETSDSNYVLCWGNKAPTNGVSKIVLEPNGTIISNEYLEWSNLIDTEAIEILTDTTLALIGNTYNTTNFQRTGFFSEMGNDGVINWTKTYPNTEFHDLIVTDSSVFISGKYLSTTVQRMLMKTNIQGAIDWMHDPLGDVDSFTDGTSKFATITDSTALLYTRENSNPGYGIVFDYNGGIVETFESFMSGQDVMATGNGGALFLGNGPRFGIKLWESEIGLVQMDTAFYATSCFYPFSGNVTQLSNWSYQDTSFALGASATVTSSTLTFSPFNLSPDDRCVSLTSDIIELEQSFVHVYPNVSDGVFHFEISQNYETTIEVYSSTGQLIYEKKSVLEKTSIDLSSYAAGSYYFKATLKNGRSDTGILIIQK